MTNDEAFEQCKKVLIRELAKENVKYINNRPVPTDILGFYRMWFNEYFKDMSDLEIQMIKNINSALYGDLFPIFDETDTEKE